MKSSLNIDLFFFAALGFAKTELSEIKKYSVDTLYSKLRAKDSSVVEAVKQKKINLNKETILGYTVLEHAETPGLGAKAPEWFQKGQPGCIVGKNPGQMNMTVSKL